MLGNRRVHVAAARERRNWLPLTCACVTLPAWITIGLLSLLVIASFSRWVMNNPRQDVASGLAWRVIEIYSAVFHRLRVVGIENVPEGWHAGPLIVVVNHTAGVDPLLVQTCCPFEIRWMMTADMRLPALERLWSYGRIIFVDQGGGDIAGAREAIRHVKSGGVLGIFPEGGLERPRRHVMPFEPGIGFLVRRTGAPVLCAIVQGTPEIEPAWASLWRRSNSRVTFKPPIDYRGSKLSAEDISADLRRRYLEWTGWPPADRQKSPAPTAPP